MFCGTCGNSHDYKTFQSLQRHEKAAAHKRSVDAKFAATEEAVFCDTCGSGHDFKTTQN